MHLLSRRFRPGLRGQARTEREVYLNFRVMASQEACRYPGGSLLPRSPMSRPLLLIVDGEPLRTSGLVSAMEGDGWVVRWIQSEEVQSFLETAELPDLVLLDPSARRGGVRVGPHAAGAEAPAAGAGAFRRVVPPCHRSGGAGGYPGLPGSTQTGGGHCGLAASVSTRWRPQTHDARRSSVICWGNSSKRPPAGQDPSALCAQAPGLVVPLPLRAVQHEPRSPVPCSKRWRLLRRRRQGRGMSPSSAVVRRRSTPPRAPPNEAEAPGSLPISPSVASRV